MAIVAMKNAITEITKKFTEQSQWQSGDNI